jgi:hypothetical protein
LTDYLLNEQEVIAVFDPQFKYNKILYHIKTREIDQSENGINLAEVSYEACKSVTLKNYKIWLYI